MKKITTILAALTVVCAFLCVGAYAFENEPDGFEGIRWGTTIAEVKEVKRELRLQYHHTDPRYGGIQIYKKRQNWLKTLLRRLWGGYKVWGEESRALNTDFGGVNFQR